MRSEVDVFYIEEPKHIGKFPVSILNTKYDEWRKKGYGVLIDREGDVCVDTEEPEDDRKYYHEQIKELEEFQNGTPQ